MQCADAKQRVLEFKHGSVSKLMITSYETLRKHSADLAGTFDLLVCDEGHRWGSCKAVHPAHNVFMYK